MNMTNLRPPLNLSDLTYDSRIIEKITEEIFDTIDELLVDAIDIDYPAHLEDEELDDYLDRRRVRIARIIAKCMLGPDMIKEEDR